MLGPQHQNASNSARRCFSSKNIQFGFDPWSEKVIRLSLDDPLICVGYERALFSR